MFMYKCNGVLMSSQSLLYVSKSVCVPVYCLCVVCVLVCMCAGADPGWGPRGPGPPPSRCAWPFPKRAQCDY